MDFIPDNILGESSHGCTFPIKQDVLLLPEYRISIHVASNHLYWCHILSHQYKYNSEFLQF